MIESEIVASGSMTGVLSGKHYNRCVRAHKIMYEAMERLRFQAFEDSLTAVEEDAFNSIAIEVQEDSGREKFLKICASSNVAEAKEMYDQFIQRKSEENASFRFWSTYLDMHGPTTAALDTCDQDVRLAFTSQYTTINDPMFFCHSPH